MFDFIKNFLQRRKRDGIVQSALALQNRYWSFDEGEFRELSGRRGDLNWAETLRLHHLACSRLVTRNDVRESLFGDDLEGGREGLFVPEMELVRELGGTLLGQESPYRPRHSSLWRLEEGADSPGTSGLLVNASLTHLGSLELVKSDPDGTPREMEFVSLDSVRALVYGPPSLFRVVKVFFEYGREDEVFWAPLLYGFSYLSQDPLYREGRMTRFGAFPGGGDAVDRFGVGVGQQDLMLQPVREGEEASLRLLGLGSVREAAMALDVEDPRFDRKCHHRGINPHDIRNNLN